MGLRVSKGQELRAVATRGFGGFRYWPGGLPTNRTGFWDTIVAM